MTTVRPVVLVVLDGWGIGPDDPGNAILAANTPAMDRLQASYPTTTLQPTGRASGLPEGQMGNSEVGHLNLGAGYVVNQWITRIDAAIEDGSFFENDVFHGAVQHVQERDSALHLLGLVGDGGVHASQSHLVALLQLAHDRGVKRVYVHAFMDGRDTTPTSGHKFVEDLLVDMKHIGTGQLATITGRYYAMDRDRRWERTRQAYEAIVHGDGARASDPLGAIRESYETNVTDEFIKPIVLVSESDEPVATLSDGDAAIFMNFRADRVRQITDTLVKPETADLEPGGQVQDLHLVTMTEYDPALPAHVAFPPENIEFPLARVISDAGMTQFHTAETEKYPHVTYFFNGGREEPFPGEERGMVNSPKVATYDLQPEMSAPEVTKGLIDAIESERFDFLIVNYANGDMVGHTGVFEAAVKALETVDNCLDQVVQTALDRNGVVIVTSDHGNADEMLIPGTDKVWTAHTMNPVPLILVSPEDSPYRNVKLRPERRLADVAPTILHLLGLQKPDRMTGQSLIED